VNCSPDALTAMVGAAGVTVTDATGVGCVDALARFDGVPSTAFEFSVPRNATISNWYAVFAMRPYNVQVNGLPTVVPASGVVQPPRVTLVAVAQASGATAKRTS